MDPLISVITPSFNQGRYIRQTIESVLSQNYSAFEHIVIDGGSTDDTVAILKSYPHIQWISESDTGQTNALNKGFSRARGDVIAWINSDDWYAPGAFHAAVNALKNSPVVMGACDLIQDPDKPLYRVANYERTIFDLFKYWIPYSIPTQPSIFFYRGLLESLRRPDGSFLDEELYYLMDYDLWMRMAQRHPFNIRLEKVLSYYRMTDNNKTSNKTDSMPYAEPEMSRIFHRYKNDLAPANKKISFILPLRGASIALASRTSDTVLLQSLRDYEIILADYSPSTDESKVVKKLAADLNEHQRNKGNHNYARYTATGQHNATAAAIEAAKGAEGELLFLAQEGTILGSHLGEEIVRLFSDDRLGAVLSLHSSFQLQQALLTSESDELLKAEKILLCPPIPLVFAIRKLTLVELGGTRYRYIPSMALRDLSLRAMFKGWQVRATRSLSAACESSATSEQECDNLFSQCICAKLLLDLHEEFQRDPFAALRASSNFSVSVPDKLIEESRQLLSAPPAGWHERLSGATPN